jgi:hypothetical protein
MAIAGDIREITFNNEDAGSGTFKPIAGEDGTFDLGGRRTLDEDVITSDGEKVNKISMMSWKYESSVRWDAANGKDLEKLTLLSGSTKDTDFTFELMDGTIYGGTGRPVGDLVGSAKDGTISIKVTGGGGLREI